MCGKMKGIYTQNCEVFKASNMDTPGAAATVAVTEAAERGRVDYCSGAG